MIVLGMTTATRICGIAVTENKNLLGEYRLNVRNIHARWIVGATKHLLTSLRMTMQEIDAIAAAIGPGSFTGLRIGLSVSKGLSFGLPVQFTGVNTLRALAFQAPVPKGTLCAILKSKKDEYYAAVFHKTPDKMEQIGKVKILHSTECARFIPEDSWVVGDVESFVKNRIVYQKAHFAPHLYNEPNGYTIAMLGEEQIRQGEIQDVKTVEPAYFQNFIAVKTRAAIS